MSSALPKVSIAMITFNHERFIEQAVLSVLRQRVPFQFEIVIGEDASTDHTRDRLLALKEQHPHRIRLLLHDTNIGMLRNFTETILACRGEYLALLEGDDYWIDPLKLQKQTALLDAHPEIAICHHNAYRVAEESDETPFLIHPDSPRLMRRRQTLDDLMSRNPIVTCTAMLRNGLVTSFPDWFFQSRMGDWPLHVLAAMHGDIAYIPEIMGVYRAHATSNWSRQSRLVDLQGIIASAELMKQALPRREQLLIDDANQLRHAEIVQLLLAEGKEEQANDWARDRLTDPSGYHRLKSFYSGLSAEEQGRTLDASRLFLASLSTGWNRTPLRQSDIFLALGRTLCPCGYQGLRSLHRRLSGKPTPIRSQGDDVSDAI